MKTRPPARLAALATDRIRTARHHRHTRSVFAVLLILASIAAVRTEHRRAGAERDAWGPTVTVWTAAADLEAGHVLGPDDLVERILPPAAIPRDPVTEAPQGLRLIDAVAEGEIVRVGRTHGGAAGTDSSRIGPGRGGVALSAAAPHLEIGDRVDLYGLLDGNLVAAGAQVIDVDDDVPVVIVDEPDLGAVIRAFTTGDVVAVLTG